MKSNKPNREKKKVTKSDAAWDEYLNTLSHKMEPATDSFIKRMGIEVVTYARENERALSLDSFLSMKGIGRKTWWRWIEKHPDLKECHDQALDIFCDRRDRGAAERKLDGNYIKWSMAFHSPRYREFEEWRSGLNKDKEEQQNKIVVIEKFVEKE